MEVDVWRKKLFIAQTLLIEKYKIYKYTIIYFFLIFKNYVVFYGIDLALAHIDVATSPWKRLCEGTIDRHVASSNRDIFSF